MKTVIAIRSGVSDMYGLKRSADMFSGKEIKFEREIQA